MNRVIADRPLYYICIVLFLAMLLMFPGLIVHAEKSRDLIVVIDVSTSMSDLMNKAKAEAKQFVSSAQMGDRITVITFGESSQLLERARIKSSYDIARILWRIDNLAATEFSTNLPSAMARGLEEMKNFYEADPDGERVFLWLSDEKSNPPEDIENLITFESLKNRESNHLPDHKWFVFQAPIEAEAESDMDWFVDWAVRTKMALKTKLLTADLGTLLAPFPEKEIIVRFEPDTEAVWGTTFSVVAEAKGVSGGSYSASIPISPSVIVCRGKPWEETFTVTLPDRPGNYKCRISFVLPSDKLLEISPPQIALKGRVQPQIRTIGEQFASLEDAMPATRVKSFDKKQSYTQTAFAAGTRRKLAREASESVDRIQLVFGPIVAGGEYRESASLFPSRNIPLESLYLKTHFELPKGLELKPSFRVSDGTLVADILLTANNDPRLVDGWEVRGPISFLSTEEGVKINPSSIPVRFYSKNQGSRWGKRELQTAPTYGRLGEIMRTGGSYALTVAKAIPAILVLLVLIFLAKRFLFVSTELIGTLEMVEAPNGATKKKYNLCRMGRLKATNSLTIGSSKNADIVLPHDSVGEMHARISTARTNAGAVVLALPLNHNQIVVNGAAYGFQKEIGNRDVLSIGDYVLTYKCPELYRETLLEFIDGRRIRGVLISWDIDAPVFEFLPKGAPSIDARMIVEFSELKSVSFIRQAGRFSRWGLSNLFKKPANGRPLEVIFEDGDLLEGYMVGEENEWSKRFYLIPKEQSEVALVLVERSAVQAVDSGYAFGPQFS